MRDHQQGRRVSISLLYGLRNTLTIRQLLKSLRAKRYERMMKANGINHNPPSIRDAPTASRPRKKKATPDPPSATIPRKRKLAKVEEAQNRTFKEKREKSATKVERDQSLKADPELPNDVSGGPNDYPWYEDTTLQHDYESQTRGDNASFNYSFTSGNFEHPDNGHSDIQSSVGSRPYGSKENETPGVKSYEANSSEAMTTNWPYLEIKNENVDVGSPYSATPTETITTKYPYLEIKDESTYVNPYDVGPAESVATKYPYLSIKGEDSYVSPYEVMNADPIKSTHTSPFSLEHCTNGYMKPDSPSRDTQAQPSSTASEKEIGSILIAD